MSEVQEERPAPSDALAIADSPGRHIRISDRGLAFESASEVFKVAQAMVAGGVAPSGMTAGGAMAAMLKGRALGLDEITSITSITVIKGRTQMQGSLLLALLKRAGVDYDIWHDGEDKTRKAHIRAWWPRHKARAKERAFGYSDAVRAGLIVKDIYKAWPDEMYLWRAVANIARQEFPEVGAGIYVHGEVPGDPEPTTEGADEASPASPVGADPLMDALAAAKAPDPDAGAMQQGAAPTPEVSDGSAAAGDVTPTARPPVIAPPLAPPVVEKQKPSGCRHEYAVLYLTGRPRGTIVVCEECTLEISKDASGLKEQQPEDWVYIA